MEFSESSESSESSPLPADQNTGDAPGTDKSIKRLALASILLSLAPLLVVVLVFLFASQLFPSPPLGYNPYSSPDDPSGAYRSQIFTTIFLLSVVSLIGSVSATITGKIAVRRVRQANQRLAEQPGWASLWWETLATLGRIIGLLGIGAVLVGAPCVFCSLSNVFVMG